jgi:hypothetical protein
MPAAAQSLLKFLIGLVAGLAMGCICYYQLFFLQAGNPPPKGGAKHAAVIEHKIQDAAKLPSPKFLLVGGSSVGCGISAKMISEEMNVPTYNFSFWGSLGSSYILHLAKKVLKPGDTVLLCLEYEILDWPGISPYWLDQSFLRFVMGVEPEFIESKPFIERLWTAYSMPPGAILSGLTSWVGGKEKIQFDFYEDHNPFGDSIENISENKMKNLNVYDEKIREPSEVFLNGFTGEPKGSNDLEAFLRWANKHKVKVLATYPNLAANEKYSEHHIRNVETKIKGYYQDNGISPLGSVRKALYDQEWFYNTNYHLLSQGVAVRTAQLIHYMKNSNDNTKF